MTARRRTAARAAARTAPEARSGPVLVTGGAGFIGSNFVRHLLARTRRPVLVVDKLTYAGDLATLADVRKDPRVTFVRADIGDARAMGALLARFRPVWVVNFAAETHVDRSIDSPRPFVETNIVATFELLETLRRYWTALGERERRRFRFLHVSTDEVYGSLGERGRFSEESAYAPNSPYAASKAAADHLVRAYGRTYGLPVLLTNCSNNYGPFQYPEKLVPLMILNAVEGRPLPVYGDGRHVREWLYVEDHCAGILRVLRRAEPGARYNIGGGETCDNLALVGRLCRLLEDLYPARENPALRRQGIREYRALVTFVPDRPGHDRRYAIDARRIRRDLGWAARYSLEAGLRRTVRWYLTHRDWCRAVQRGRYDRERLGLLAGEGR